MVGTELKLDAEDRLRAFDAEEDNLSPLTGPSRRLLASHLVQPPAWGRTLSPGVAPVIVPEGSQP